MKALCHVSLEGRRRRRLFVFNDTIVARSVLLGITKVRVTRSVTRTLRYVNTRQLLFFLVLKITETETLYFCWC